MWLKRIFISIGILAAVGGGGFILYNVAYAVGDAAGYDEGYLAGQKVGYITGNQDGYDDGYNLGQDEGYGEGEAAGYAEGYADGVDAGTGHGYCLQDPTYAEAVAFSGHSLVAFDTIDQGLVYFEPQFDDEVRVELGRSYSQLNDYVIPSFDDVIRDILVIW
ncbi:MAG: hypothetical protein NT134_01620 [Chloroflexi bacterium]|nr:hypothetical protein [Chloroflexota bacterium]